MRAPSKRTTFILAFIVANLVLFFPFATPLDDASSTQGENRAAPAEVPTAEAEPPDADAPELPRDEEEAETAPPVSPEQQD